MINIVQRCGFGGNCRNKTKTCLGIGAPVFQPGINTMPASNGSIDIAKRPVVLAEMLTVLAGWFTHKITSNIVYLN